MRMDRRQGPTAADLVNRLPEDELANLIYRMRRGAGLAAHRPRDRGGAQAEAPRDHGLELAEVVRRSAAGRSRRPGLDPATRTFQALRIAVNERARRASSRARSKPSLPASRSAAGWR